MRIGRDRRSIIPLPPVEGGYLYWYAGLLTLCMLGAAWCGGFHQLHNDFWDCVFIARHLSLHDIQSLFNPQYPIGYTSFLKTIGGPGLPVTPAIIANCAFAGVMLLAFGTLCRSFIPGRAAAIALLMLAFFPRMFHYNTVGGGDPGSVAFFTLGAVLILTDVTTIGGTKTIALPLIGGMLIGLAALFRYHVFVGDILFLLSLCIVYRKAWPRLLVAAIGVGIAYSPQWTINVLTGHGLFKTQFGPMNVYDLMYSLNWYRSTSLDLPSSVIAIILQDPLLFVKKYAIAFVGFSYAWILPLAATLTAKERPVRKLCAAIFLWTFIYFALFSATTSGRQILLALPLVFFSVAVLLHTVWLKSRAAAPDNGVKPRRATIAVALLCLCTLAVFCQRDVHKVILRSSERGTCAALETLLRSHGCTSVNQVFATDYDVYFDDMPPYTLLSNGGAPRWGTYGVKEELPEFPVDTLEAFTKTCRERGVRWVVLTSEAEKYSEALGEVYRTEISMYFRPIAKIDRFSVFEIKDN